MPKQSVTGSMEEKTKKTVGSKAKAPKISSSDIREAYIDFVLSNNKAPSSVFQFAKSIKLKEEEFYQHYASFNSLEKEIWANFFTDTLEVLEKDVVYKEYSAREKMLSFYYTWIEVLKKHRSFVLYSLQNHHGLETPKLLQETKGKFKEFVSTILSDAIQNEEIVVRPYLSDRYDDALWLQALFVLHFWAKDDSKAFEKTDAAIEKAVNLSFELMAKSPLDGMIDFAKFLYQSRK